MSIPRPFPTPTDWPLNSVDYPAVFLIDSSWAEDPKFTIEPRSLTTRALVGNTPLKTISEDDNHGEKTRYIIETLANNLPNQKVALVSLNRQNILGNNDQQRLSNLPEAILSVQARLNPGDLVVINVGADGGQDSFVRDSLVAILLREITDSLGGIVVISAGNLRQPLSPTATDNVIVVGGVSSDGKPESRFGDFVTCYGVVPYNLPGYPVPVRFGSSSAATAYTAGMVLMILNYATLAGLDTQRQSGGWTVKKQRSDD